MVETGHVILLFHGLGLLQGLPNGLLLQLLLDLLVNRFELRLVLLVVLQVGAHRIILHELRWNLDGHQVARQVCPLLQVLEVGERPVQQRIHDAALAAAQTHRLLVPKAEAALGGGVGAAPPAPVPPTAHGGGGATDDGGALDAAMSRLSRAERFALTAKGVWLPAALSMSHGGGTTSVAHSLPATEPHCRISERRSFKPAFPWLPGVKYTTEWRPVQETRPGETRAPVLVLGGAALQASEGGSLTSWSWSAVAVASAWRRGCAEARALSALEEALGLVQAQSAMLGLREVWLLTPFDASAAHRSADAAHAGMWGLARSVRSEAQLPVRCIGASVSSAVGRGGMLTEPEVVLHSKRCLVSRLASISPGTSSSDAHLQLSEGHLVTGGTGGLGLLTAGWLAHRGARALLLVSRSGALAAGSTAEWERLQMCGAVAKLERCGTGEDTHVRRAVLLAQQLALSGIWHAAGALADGLLPKQSAASLWRVWAPKVSGLWALHTASASVVVRACVLFSSVSALLGSAGQANYSAANACLDALAARRHPQTERFARAHRAPDLHVHSERCTSAWRPTCRPPPGVTSY